MKLFKILLLGLFIVASSCRRVDIELEQALMSAKENRVELERVLNHYARSDADSLKYKAAVYLIKYMPYHYSLSGKYEDYCNAVDSAVSKTSDSGQLQQIIQRLSEQYASHIEPSPNILHITSDFLIHNIEQAFVLWQDSLWACHLDFDRFCEYLLPYQCINGQPLENWRDSLYNICRGSMDILWMNYDYEYNPLSAVSTVNNALKKTAPKQRWVNDLRMIPVRDVNTLLKMPFGGCEDYAYTATAVMRSKGLPIAIDYTPQWPDRLCGHSWCVMYSQRGDNQMFNPLASHPYNPHYPYGRFAKIFRKTYRTNPELLALLRQGYEFPRLLKDILMQDVTDEYEATSDLTVETFRRRYSTDLAFLSVFDNYDWCPVYWGEMKRGKATFRKMGRNITYLPTIYRDSTLLPIGYPFEVDGRGKITPICIDTVHRQTIRLDRKCQIYQKVYNVKGLVQYGTIEASDHRDFRDAVVMAEFPQWTLTSGSEKVPAKAYRYWRFRATKEEECDVAELYFYTKEFALPIKGELIDSGEFVDNDTEHGCDKIADGDPLTYFRAKGDCWVGFDFQQPITIDHVSYIRRGDGNAICPGDVYELYYWNNDRWVLHDKQIATDVVLQFDNVPINGLYYIKGLSRGRANRIFTWKDNRPYWH